MRVWNLGFRDKGLGWFRIEGWGFGSRVWFGA